MEDFDRCYRALKSRDARFDGWFFTAVTSTGIYCRPSCPALTPKRENVRFYPTSAAAQQAGFRACLRCRPDAAPGSPQWLGRADVASRAVKLVLDGVVDREGVSGLARRLGYGERQLHRVLMAEVGTGALALARAQRAQTARLLVETTDLPLAQVAFAAGFASVRQFNDTVRVVFARTPGQLRAAARQRGGNGRTRDRARHGAGDEAVVAPVISVRLAHRRPLHVQSLFAFLARRAVPGLERADGDSFARSLRLAHGPGVVQLEAGDGCLEARFTLSDLRDLNSAIARARHLANLDADPVAVDLALGEDPRLAPSVQDRPGLRVPGSVDGFETAVRAVLGQQVSLGGARALVAAVLSETGTPAVPGHRHLHVFPSPDELAQALGSAAPARERRPRLPATRRRALQALCAEASSGRLAIDAGADPAEVTAALLALPGVGPWTAGYVVMRGLGDPDAFLPTDLGARRGAEHLGIEPTPARLAGHSERWRPWRAHGLMHLWSVPHSDGSRTGRRTSRTREESAA
ncbi:MAG TPA: AraC family transcriptional regulator [Acidimicrobiaceae bacterium]|nr:AraC family transcriptional regulator [Acidimicrobiaceae bacterium]